VNEIVVYGSSDDLIEIEGGISEEFSAPSGGKGLLAFSDGTLLRFVYDAAGVWRFTLAMGGRAEYEKAEAPEGDDDNYSDRVRLIGDIHWVALGEVMAWAS